MRITCGQYTVTSIRATLRESQEQGKGDPSGSGALPLSVIEEDADMVDIDIDREKNTVQPSSQSCSSAYPSSMFCSMRVCSGSKTRRTHLARVERSKNATGSGSIGVVEWQEQLLLPEAANVVDLELHLDLFEGPKERDKTCFEVLSRKLALLAVGSPLDFPEHWEGGEGIKAERRFRLVGFSTFMLRKNDATDGQPRFTKHKIQDSTGQLTGELELGLRFTPCLLEGFLSQKSGGLCNKCMGMFTCLSPVTGGDWSRRWLQLLGDGTLLSWGSPSQRASSEPTCIFVGTHPSCCTGISLIGGGNRDQFRVDFGGGGVWRFKAANESQAKVWVQAMKKLWMRKSK